MWNTERAELFRQFFLLTWFGVEQPPLWGGDALLIRLWVATLDGVRGIDRFGLADVEKVERKQEGILSD